MTKETLLQNTKDRIDGEKMKELSVDSISFFLSFFLRKLGSKGRRETMVTVWVEGSQDDFLKDVIIEESKVNHFLLSSSGVSSETLKIKVKSSFLELLLLLWPCMTS